jgi:chitodextrinase
VSGRDGIRIISTDGIACDDNIVDGNLATDNQATKTQSYGLNIASGSCNRTVVGTNDFAGNRVGSIRDLGTNTIYPPPTSDSEPPSQPTGLQAVAISGCRVDLNWLASTDNVGVTGYGVYRDSALLATVGGSTLSLADTTVSPGMTYTYAVDATDTSTNHSVLSAPAVVATPGSSCGTTLVPTADSWVDASQPAVNNGTKTQLRADGSPILVSYLKFNVQVSGSVSRATLRIFANSSHSVGFAVRPVADTSWTETGLTYDNAPGSGAVAASSGPLAAGTWVEVDVTGLVATNGLLSLALTTTSGTAMSLGSREAGSTSPQLIVEAQ